METKEGNHKDFRSPAEFIVRGRENHLDNVNHANDDVFSPEKKQDGENLPAEKQDAEDGEQVRQD